MNECCTELENIGRACGSNAPGMVPEIELICRDSIDLAAFPDVVDGAFAAVLPLADGVTGWNRFKVSNWGDNYTSTPEGDPDGQSRPNTLTVFLPKRTKAKTRVLNALGGGEYYVVFKDKNGHKVLLGNADEGSFITVAEQTRDKNGYQLTIVFTAGHMPHEYPFVNAILPDPVEAE